MDNLLKGKARVIYFDDKGKISKKLSIDTYTSNGPITLFIPQDVYHTLSLMRILFLEVKQGPFKRFNTISKLKIEFLL